MASYVLLVANPRAGRAGDRRWTPERWRDALERVGFPIRVAATEGPGDAILRVADAVAGAMPPEGIVVLGGDGTMNEVVRGLLHPDGAAAWKGKRIWVAPLAGGRGGDFSRSLRGSLPRAPEEAARALRDRAPRAVDVGWIRAGHACRPFLNVASVGLGGHVDDVADKLPRWLGGALTYAGATALAATRYRPARTRVVVDDVTVYEGPIRNVVVANGRFFGGGMRVAEEAAIDDGQLDALVLPPVRMFGELRRLRALYAGSIDAERHRTHRFRGRSVLVEALDVERERSRALLDIDGEVGPGLPVRFDVDAGALLLRA